MAQSHAHYISGFKLLRGFVALANVDLVVAVAVGVDVAVASYSH